MSKKKKLSIAVLASGNGSNLQAIIDQVEEKLLPATIGVVISDKSDAYALKRAQKSKIPTHFVDPGKCECRGDYDAEVAIILKRYEVDLIVLAGYMRILGEEFVREFEGKIINIHPSLLPAFPGMHSVADAMESNAFYTGCTVHFVDGGVDTGPIILQRAVNIKDRDTLESLHNRIHKQEYKILPKAIHLIADGKVKYKKSEGVVKMNKKRALISVWDKTGAVEFAEKLVELGFEIISSGGTSKALADAGIAHLKVADVTGSPEILGGRVKTLHPKVHGGILANRALPEHMSELDAHGITAIDIVAVNLYPFQKVTANPDVTLADAVENIDIGGSALIRAAAKNHSAVAVIVNPGQYDTVIAELQEKGYVSDALRGRMAVEAYRHSAVYDTAISAYLSKVYESGSEYLPQATVGLNKAQELRYGENPGQTAAFYTIQGVTGGLGAAKQLQGKELSYNNYLDMDAALRTVLEFKETAAVVVKHTNPCGVAIGEKMADAYYRAREADSLSAFGGVVALNRVMDLDTAKLIKETFIEAVIAPGFSAEALDLLQDKENLRLLELKDFVPVKARSLRSIQGGMLVQDIDDGIAGRPEWKRMCGAELTAEDIRDIEFATCVAKHVKSNAIILAKDGVTLGIGAGQMSRVESVNISMRKAGDKVRGAILISDAFFPFRDSIDMMADKGLKIIVEPGGSVRDDDVVKAAEEAGITLVFTGRRHFLH